MQSYLEAHEIHGDTRIAIIEAGPKIYDGNVSNSIVAPSQTGQPFRLFPTTAAAVGGTSNLWHGVIAPLDPEDFTHRPNITEAQWPITLADLSPWYHWVAQHLNWGSHLFHPINWSDELRHLIEEANCEQGDLVPKLFLRTKPVLRIADKILKLVEERDHIDLFADHTALEVGADWENGLAHVTHLLAGTRSGEIVKFFTTKVVLCAGALQSPRILLNSLPDWHLKYAAAADHVGKYLMDHPMGPLFQVDWGVSSERKIFVGTPHGKKQNVVAALRPSPEAQKRYMLSNTAFYLRPSPAQGEDQAAEDTKLALLTVVSKLKRRRIPYREAIALIKRPWLTWQVIQFKLGFALRHRYSMGYVVAEQRPIKESAVCLSDRRDIWGYKEIDVHWSINSKDIDDLEVLYKLVEKEFHISSPPDTQFWRAHLSSAAHHLGTCRMSKDADGGVVDKSGQVFGTRGLYVADGSTFVTSGNVNSTFSIMANAARIGQMID